MRASCARTVQQWTGIPVSVGIAPTKTLAKVANRLAKKDAAAGGVRLSARRTGATGSSRPPGTDRPVGHRRPPGRSACARSASRRRSNCATRILASIRERFSVVLERMVLELRGVACLGLEEVTPDRKSIMASRSFGRAVETRRELEEAVSVYTARAAEKMRRQNLATASLAGLGRRPTASNRPSGNTAPRKRCACPWRRPTPAS